MKKDIYSFALQFSPYMLTRDDKIAEVSNAWVTVTEYGKDEIAGWSVKDIWRKLLKENHDDLQIGQDQKTYSICTKTNTSKEVNIYVYHGKQGETIYIFEETGQWVNRNEIEKMKKRIEEKDEFLSHISHELRTPLTVINSAIQVMQELYKGELTPNVTRYVYRIKQNSLRLLRVVNNLLDITRANAGKMKIHERNMDIVLISRVITESVLVYAQQKNIMLTFSSSVPERVIRLDDEKYERILLNLLSNAIKFTPEGRSICVNISLKQKYICVEVKDEGVGIPEDKQDVIFNRFGQVDGLMTRSEEGTGIGLSLVKMLVNALGGEISVSSEEGKGSTFTVLLPDQTMTETVDDKVMGEEIKNNLVLISTIEFSDIYLHQ